MSLPGRLVLLAAAIVIMCLASAFYFTADLSELRLTKRLLLRF